jgi:hypothetical protein
MAIENRDLGTGQQRTDRAINILAATGAATTHIVYMAPTTQQLDVVRVYCAAGTGTSVVNLSVRRNLAAGATVLVNLVGTTLTLSAATGPQGYTLFTGASAFQLQAGDIVHALVDGVTSAQVQVVVKSLQDIKSFYGV